MHKSQLNMTVSPERTPVFDDIKIDPLVCTFALEIRGELCIFIFGTNGDPFLTLGHSTVVCANEREKLEE